MEGADVDGALIVQPINHKFDHSLVTRSDKKCLFVDLYILFICVGFFFWYKSLAYRKVQSNMTLSYISMGIGNNIRFLSE